LIDAVIRQITGVLRDDDSLGKDSFSEWLLSFPRSPHLAELRGVAVPHVLLSGDHAEIAKWRQNQCWLRLGSIGWIW
jgi:tRNA (guanine37-N1)-methyltransferase